MVDDSRTDNIILASLLDEKEEVVDEINQVQTELDTKKDRLRDIQEILKKFDL